MDSAGTPSLYTTGMKHPRLAQSLKPKHHYLQLKVERKFINSKTHQ